MNLSSHKNLIILLIICLVCNIFFSNPTLAANTEQTKPVIKIGVFDSRVVALAYFRSAEQMTQLKEMHQEMQQAKAENNEKRIKELEKEDPWTQIRMYQQVFSNAGVSNIM